PADPAAAEGRRLPQIAPRPAAPPRAQRGRPPPGDRPAPPPPPAPPHAPPPPPTPRSGLHTHFPPHPNLPLPREPPTTPPPPPAARAAPGRPPPRAARPSPAAEQPAAPAPPGASIRPPPPDHHRNRLQQDLQIQPQIPVPDVLQVQRRPLVEVRDLGTALHLPEARDPGDHRQLPVLPRLERRELLRRRRTRADQAHVPLQHAPELRQLVQAELAQPPTDRSDPGIVAHLEDGAAHLVPGEELALQLVCVRHHGAELVPDERPRPLPEHSPGVEDRPLRRQPHEQREDHEQRREQDQP